MYKRILLPLGLSEFKAGSIKPLLKQLADSQAKVTLLHVIEPISDADDREVSAFLQRLQERAESYLQEVAQELGELLSNVEYQITTGKRSTRIVEFAKQEQIDFILMSAKQSVNGPLTPQELGNLGNLVAMMAPCSVLISKD